MTALGMLLAAGCLLLALWLSFPRRKSTTTRDLPSGGTPLPPTGQIAAMRVHLHPWQARDGRTIREVYR
jgi:hypothetical protein